MRLYDGAVLLIIGAAVVGPIYPPMMEVTNDGIESCRHIKIDGEEGARAWRACISTVGGWQYDFACERAMREIGATKEWPYPDNPRQPKPPTKGAWYLKDTRVFCIPAPSGLTK